MPRINPLAIEVKQGRPKDGRTKTARLMKAARKAMVDQLGGDGALTAGQLLLVERASALQSQITELDRKRIESALTEREERDLRECGSQFVRIIHRLGLDRPPAPEPAPVQSHAQWLASLSRAPEEAA